MLFIHLFGEKCNQCRNYYGCNSIKLVNTTFFIKQNSEYIDEWHWHKLTSVLTCSILTTPIHYIYLAKMKQTKQIKRAEE